MSEMSRDEITILSATDKEVYAYIKATSIDNDWPLELYYNSVTFMFDAWWTLPTEMGSGYVQAARYTRAQPEE
jgi:hypothetical protein